MRHAEAVPLRRDMETLLRFVRDHKVIGTQGAGNMPLKAVAEVTARFVVPPKLEDKIGSYTVKVRSEVDLWPLYFLRILAHNAGLLKPGSARRWRITQKGEDYLVALPMVQLPFLLTIWWYRTNWLIAYPFIGMGEALPQMFNLFVLEELLMRPLATQIFFEEFADTVIAKTGLKWTAPDKRVGTTALHGAIARMVIHILADFEAVTREYQREAGEKKSYSTLAGFTITPLGRALLEAVAIAS